MFLRTSPQFRPMLSSDVFCFLWDDPLFNQRVQTDKQYLEDEEFIVFRRQARLIALETLYIRLSAVENSVQKWKEAAGRQAWCVKQLLDRAEIPPENLEAINIEQQVNMM